jgi:ferredoxin-NADP reductase
VTPILLHARELARRGKSFEVHYATHSRERMAFRDAVEGYVFGNRIEIMIAINESASALHDDSEERIESFKNFVLGFCHKQLPGV